MKKIYTLLLFAFAVQFSQAQNPQLFDREWKLFQLVVDGEYVPVPVDDVDLSDVNLTFTPANASSLPQLNTRICNQGVGYPDFSIAENAFFMDAFGVTLISCIDPGNNDLDNAYLLGFFQQNVPGVFNYEIFGLLNFSDTLILVITNESGDVAQYSDGNLSLKDFSSSRFRIFPNPAADYISIDFGNKKFENATVEIYDTTGKLCHSANLSGQQIDVQNLAKGMYFAKVRNRDLVSMQKFIKL